jgi:hypothetical protein
MQYKRAKLILMVFMGLIVSSSVLAGFPKLNETVNQGDVFKASSQSKPATLLLPAVQSAREAARRSSVKPKNGKKLPAVQKVREAAGR